MASTNLPVQLTSFIGRESDLANVELMLSEARLNHANWPGRLRQDAACNPGCDQSQRIISGWHLVGRSGAVT